MENMTINARQVVNEAGSGDIADWIIISDFSGYTLKQQGCLTCEFLLNYTRSAKIVLNKSHFHFRIPRHLIFVTSAKKLRRLTYEERLISFNFRKKRFQLTVCILPYKLYIFNIRSQNHIMLLNTELSLCKEEIGKFLFSMYIIATLCQN